MVRHIYIVEYNEPFISGYWTYRRAFLTCFSYDDRFEVSVIQFNADVQILQCRKENNINYYLIPSLSGDYKYQRVWLALSYTFVI